MNGARVTLAGQWVKYIVQLGGILVLARLIPPSGYGTFAALMSVAGVALVMCDFGLSVAAMSAKHLGRQAAVNLSWANAALGLILGCGVAALGPFLSSLFAVDVRGLAVLVAVTVIGQALAVQPKAIAIRAGRYRWVAMSEVAAQVAALVAALIFASAGFGAVALAMQLLVGAWIGLALVVVRAPIAFGLPRRDSETGLLFRVGRDTAGSQAMNFASTNAAQFGLGWLNSAAETGYYNRAIQLAVIPMQQIASPLTRVALPALARMKDDPSELVATLKRTQLMLCYLLLAPCAGFIAAPSLFVEVLLGADWSSSAEPLRLLAVGVAIQASTYVFYWAYIVMGRTGALFSIEASGRFVMIVGSVLLAPFGSGPVAVAVVFGQALIAVVSLTFGSRALGLPVWKIAGQAARPIALLSICTIAAFLVHSASAGNAAGILFTAIAFLAPISFSALAKRYREDFVTVLDAARGKF